MTKNEMNAKKMKELEIIKSQQPNVYQQIIIDHGRSLQCHKQLKSPFAEHKSFANQYSASKNDENIFKVPPPMIHMKN